MANLKRRHAFKRWAPDIGENRDLPEPALYLEVAVGLTAETLNSVLSALAAPIKPPPPLDKSLTGEALIAALKARTEANLLGLRQHYAKALAPYVRVFGGPHTVDGMRLETLEDYFALVQAANDYGAEAIKELIAALRTFNSFSGSDELFSLRRSGGLGSTATQSVEKVEPQTDAQ